MLKKNFKRMHLIVKGKVQGVFFREFTKKCADTMGIKGGIRNLADGSVEIIAEATINQLEKFLRYLPKHEKSRIDKIEKTFSLSKNKYTDFQIWL